MTILIIYRYIVTRRYDVSWRICAVQIQPWTRALDDADYTPPTRQHEVLFDRTHEKCNLPRLADREHRVEINDLSDLCAM